MRKNWIWLAAAGGGLLAARQLQQHLGYTFRNKTVFITGGSRGLGLVLARQLAREGARVAICARDAEELDRAREQLSALSGRTIALACDLTYQDEVVDTVEAIGARMGSIDVLINNAGTISVGPLDSMTMDDYRKAMDVNFWGPLYAVLAVLPGMRKRGGGRIVNITSIGAKIGVPHLLAYSASKHALAGLSKGLRAELKKENILVTTIYPGLMRTGSPRNAEFKGQHDKEYAWFSVSDSLPLTSMSAERAARQILNACRRGDAERVLSFQAKAATLFNTLFPETGSAVLSLANRLLPESSGDTTSIRGRDTRQIAPEWTTALSAAAAEKNNEIP